MGGQPAPLAAPRKRLAAPADFLGAEILGTDFTCAEFGRTGLKPRKMLRASFPNQAQQSKHASGAPPNAIAT